MSEQFPVLNPVPKFPALSQLIVCTGGSCAGREGGVHSPKKALLDAWKKDYLWRVCHVSFSDCLGPCDVACNAVLLTGQGAVWLSGLTDDDYTRLTAWVQASHAVGELRPLPPELQEKTYSRFAEPGSFPLHRPRRNV